jgi:DNA-binding MarR family transcriptional regulator
MSAATAEAQRGSVLKTLEYFRARAPDVSLNSIVAFLQICEHEGAALKDIAYICRLTDATASRSVRALAAPETIGALPPALGLIEIFQNPDDARGRLVFLTQEGRALRDAIDAPAEPARAILPLSRA